MDFSIRSANLELLDQPEIPAADIELNMRELETINRTLGGHDITLNGFFRLYTNQSELHICEIGCGGGDNGRAIENKLKTKDIDLIYTGIDINPDCIRFAKSKKWKSRAHFLVNDYKKVHFEVQPDILFCSLFCHHFKNEELVEMFRWMYKNSHLGFFINDLHRHPLAYHSIRILTSLFSNSYLVKHDAPLSVLRGFKKKELEDLLCRAGISNFTIRWKWAFRWLIVVQINTARNDIQRQ
jgi:2-polyprenyl-3-methyl-5-hydroxy-6-metoxy-1,4-benzoquinol methylase